MITDAANEHRVDTEVADDIMDEDDEDVVEVVLQDDGDDDDDDDDSSQGLTLYIHAIGA